MARPVLYFSEFGCEKSSFSKYRYDICWGVVSVSQNLKEALPQGVWGFLLFQNWPCRVREGDHFIDYGGLKSYTTLLEHLEPNLFSLGPIGLLGSESQSLFLLSVLLELVEFPLYPSSGSSLHLNPMCLSETLILSWLCWPTPVVISQSYVSTVVKPQESNPAKVQLFDTTLSNSFLYTAHSSYSFRLGESNLRHNWWEARPSSFKNSCVCSNKPQLYFKQTLDLKWSHRWDVLLICDIFWGQLSG